MGVPVLPLESSEGGLQWQHSENLIRVSYSFGSQRWCQILPKSLKGKCRVAGS